jgi:hypothetical protein
MDVESQLYPLKKVLQSTRGGALLLEPSPPRNVAYPLPEIRRGENASKATGVKLHVPPLPESVRPQ